MLTKDDLGQIRGVVVSLLAEVLPPLFAESERRLTETLEARLYDFEQRANRRLDAAIESSEKRTSAKTDSAIAASERRVVKKLAAEMDARFAAQERWIVSRFEKIDRRLDDLEESLDGLARTTVASFAVVGARLDAAGVPDILGDDSDEGGPWLPPFRTSGG